LALPGDDKPPQRGPGRGCAWALLVGIVAALILGKKTGIGEGERRKEGTDGRIKFDQGSGEGADKILCYSASARSTGTARITQTGGTKEDMVSRIVS
jgi:hypothetical protein